MAAVGQSGPAAGKPGYVTGAIADTVSLATRLARDEFALAGAELGQSARKLAVALALTIFGAVFLLAGIIAASIAAVAALSLVMPIWLAASWVAGGVFVIGGIALATGVTLLRRVRFIPVRTLNSLAATADWIKERVD